MSRGSLAVYLPFLLVGALLLNVIWNLSTVSHVLSSSASYPEGRDAFHSDPTLMIDDSAARALQSRGRLLCWVPSVANHLEDRVKAINSTWIQRCDGHIFFVEGFSGSLPDVVSLDVPAGYYNLTTKVVSVLQYLYHHHLHDYDWFLKGDDDAYVIVENLRYLLAQYDVTHSPVYVGHLYKMFHKEGYMSGGASYALNRQALKLVVEDGYRQNKCTTKGKYEDLEVAKCLHSVGVASHNSRDRFGRDTFHPLKPSTHIVGPIPANQLPQDWFTLVSGAECCSQLTISFHKVDPTLIKVFDHLLYRTNVYGRVLDLPALSGLLKPGVISPQA